MFRKALRIICLAALAMPAIAQASPLNVAVSILPEKFFVEEIGGDNVNVTVIVPPGAGPATYAPTMRQMSDLSKATTYFTMGVPFEKAWVPRIASANPQLEIVPLYERICFRSWPISVAHSHDHGEAKHDDHHDHEIAHPHHPEEANPCRPAKRDPHIWVSPPLVRIMASTIRDTLIAEDPANAALYHANYRTFVNKVAGVDQAVIKALGDKAPGKSFMVYHPAYGYFARAYGLHQLAVENMGTEPSPADLAKIIKRAKDENIKIVFVQKQFSQKAAKTIAREIGGSVVAVNPLEENWVNGMTDIANAFADALK